MVDVALGCDVYARHRHIYVTAPAPTDIVIYAANGQLICQVTDTHLAVRCESGVYLVRVGRRTVKVVVE
ncbi:MAG: T9SS type A sorting domain-containing protein [Paludibacteraceae bacterium]